MEKILKKLYDYLNLVNFSVSSKSESMLLEGIIQSAFATYIGPNDVCI